MLFEDVWNNYYQRLFLFMRITYRLSLEDAEDLVQESLIKVYTHMDSFSEDYAISTWVFTIGRNTCIDFLRKQKRNPEIDAFDSGCFDLANPRDEGPSSIFIKKELEQYIDGYIKNLPAKDKELMYLRTYENLLYREITAITGDPVGSVKRRIFSIRKRLQDFLGEVYENETVFN